MCDKRFEGLAGLFERFGNFALDPFEGHVVVPISHNNSSHYLLFTRVFNQGLTTVAR